MSEKRNYLFLIQINKILAKYMLNFMYIFKLLFLYELFLTVDF